jgi:hypothetical protein
MTDEQEKDASIDGNAMHEGAAVTIKLDRGRGKGS